MPRLRLVPQTREFYALFDQAAANMVATAGLLVELLDHYPARPELVARIKEHEHEGDRLTHELVQLVHRTFVTPIDREDIYGLANVLDDICDFLDQVADELSLYGVEEVPPEAVGQARVILKAGGLIAECVGRLEGLRPIGELLSEVLGRCRSADRDPLEGHPRAPGSGDRQVPDGRARARERVSEEPVIGGAR